jgi:hypothetical protein
MNSKWSKLKPEAVDLRKQGYSIGRIESRLKIPRSTLSGWFKNIELTQKQKKKLLQNWKNGLINARKQAVIWHNKQKEKRLEEAKDTALEVLKNINFNDKNVLELALAMLYLGEGAKKNPETALGSSDPVILKFFLACLINIYNIDIKRLRCELYLRADQDPLETKRYWAKTLNLPLSTFNQVNIDNRTKGTKTYSYYKGVCNLRYGNIAIQRRLVNLADLFCKEIININ